MQPVPAGMKTYEKGMRFEDVHQNQYPFGEEGK